SRRKNTHIDLVLMPSLQRRRDVRKHLTAKLSTLIAFEPDLPLNVFQCRRFAVLVHQPVNVRGGFGGPGWGIEAMADIFIVFTVQIRQVRMLEVTGHVAAREREENVIDECNRSCRALDVEKDASRGAHQAM